MSDRDCSCDACLSGPQMQTSATCVRDAHGRPSLILIMSFPTTLRKPVPVVELPSVDLPVVSSSDASDAGSLSDWSVSEADVGAMQHDPVGDAFFDSADFNFNDSASVACPL